MTMISATMVSELRAKTGVGMMDCKAALSATMGDMEQAVDWLRAKGLSKAAKKSSRIAAEGLVGLTVKGMSAAIVEVNSETDFVARNEKFQAMVSGIATAALEAGGDVERLKAMNFPGSSHPISAYIAEMVGTIGENMTLRRSEVLSVQEGVIGAYTHNQIAPGLGRIVSVVALEGGCGKAEVQEFARQLAMHVAASNPVSLDLASVPAEILAREQAILEEKNLGKPSSVLEKIVQSGLKSYAKDNCLLEQAYVHDSSKTVAQAIAEIGNKAGGAVQLKSFLRMQLGEGIEKTSGDFAAEVAGVLNS